ncbi:GNAT family N-acetyltransferase [Fodinicola acaciae]|uniref:GNAT family N-acetyltransferase n=1 Tax=Fodinicola acaciae TaxID=2681555 RepID=UPI001FE79485|nr:GNAT family N-acetyltransferase [Fodinicola acaciae]
MTVREARREDVPAIVALLADDIMSASRGVTAEVVDGHYAAFAAIEGNPHDLLWVMEDAGELVGTLQLTFLAGLSRGGASRAQIEAVRIAASRRGMGLGGEFIKAAIEEARRRGCRMVQLTSALERTDAHRFYERLGFKQTHAGFKMSL